MSRHRCATERHACATERHNAPQVRHTCATLRHRAPREHAQNHLQPGRTDQNRNEIRTRRGRAGARLVQVCDTVGGRRVSFAGTRGPGQERCDPSAAGGEPTPGARTNQACRRPCKPCSSSSERTSARFAIYFPHPNSSPRNPVPLLRAVVRVFSWLTSGGRLPGVGATSGGTSGGTAPPMFRCGSLEATSGHA